MGNIGSGGGDWCLSRDKETGLLSLCTGSELIDNVIAQRDI